MYKSKSTAYVKYIFIGFFIISAACNPVKRVLRDPVKTQTVVDAYNKNLPQIITEPVITPGKTDTLTSILFDTLYVEGATDTITNIKRDTLRLTQVRKIYLTKTDTLTRVDPVTVSQLRSFQRIAAQEAVAKDQALKELTDMKSARSKWRLYFFILLSAVVVALGLTIYLKTLNRVKI